MASVTDSSSAAVNAASVRAELATNAIRDQNDQERQVAARLEEAQVTNEADRREARKIPGLGNAVDISV
ncbi:hypothetical protein [uncultured Roseibium sp.]|uniref:hypothetical protein n=1 Tax=uncultured Roseibium sp. TaxID=1936171 RepID=UPI002607C130|nr:hypothetical protein [uncultured Roseibium sp.]